MIQLVALTDPAPGQEHSFTKLPVILGRSAHANLVLDAPGIWDQHARITLTPGQGFVLSSLGDAITRVNGQTIQTTTLRHGDVLELGSARLQFWLAPTRQRTLVPREWLTWFALACLFALQLWLIYVLLALD